MKPRARATKPKAIGADASDEIYLLTLSILGYIPQDIMTQEPPDCITRVLGRDRLKPLSAPGEHPLVLVAPHAGDLLVSELCDALKALQEDRFGYVAVFQACTKDRSFVREETQAWLSALTNTPSISGTDNELCELTARLIAGDVARQPPFDPNYYAPWLLNAHTAFVNYRAQKELSDMDHFLGGA